MNFFKKVGFPKDFQPFESVLGFNQKLLVPMLIPKFSSSSVLPQRIHSCIVDRKISTFFKLTPIISLILKTSVSAYYVPGFVLSGLHVFFLFLLNPQIYTHTYRNILYDKSVRNNSFKWLKQRTECKKKKKKRLV